MVGKELCPERTVVTRWRGGQIALDDGPAFQPPLSSSSWNTAAVIASRAAAYRRMVATQPNESDVDCLWRYHQHHEPARGAFSVLMRRPDAATRSIIHVAVKPTAICLHYRPVSRKPSLTSSHDVRLHLARATSEFVAPAER